MNDRKDSSLVSNRRFWVMAAAQLLWLGLVLLLGGWWGRLMLKQASQISLLQEKLGFSTEIVQYQWKHTERMLFWESFSFFFLLIAATLFLFWLYWRELKRSRSIQAFFASFTHELRTPLTSIRLQAESMAENLDDKNALNKFIPRLLEDAIRLEGQVDRTLELARLEGGGPVYTQPIPVKSWLDQFLRTWIIDYGTRVDLKINVDDVVIEADPGALRIIFKNLLENSVKHSTKDRVSISLFCVPHHPGIDLKIKDDGGFGGDVRHLGKLFQKGRSSSGTGVGLYLVQMLMKKMGGKATFDSTESGGGFEATLWFSQVKHHD